MKTFSIGYSPCPNDTFIFHALVHEKIDLEGLRFREIIEDVETLNQMALHSELDITKVSFHACGHLLKDYCLLRSGSALGRECGPLVIAKESYEMKDLRGKTIAIPGRLTTAFLLLQIFDPSFKDNVKVMPFFKIIDAVKNGEADAGLIIHESRFTYQDKGLKMVIDLGQWWEYVTGLPIPLGGIIAKREIGMDLINKVSMFIRKSVEYAFENRNESRRYIKKYARELHDNVIDQHINLYVNKYTIDIGNDGEQAIKELFKRAESYGIIRQFSGQLFI